MSRAEVVARAKLMGYAAIQTAGGRVPLDTWKPYGKKSGHTIGFHIDGESIRESDPTSGRGFQHGVWTLLK